MIKLKIYLKNGKVIFKDVASWEDRGFGLIAFNSAGQSILRVNLDGLEAFEIIDSTEDEVLESQE